MTWHEDVASRAIQPWHHRVAQRAFSIDYTQSGYPGGVEPARQSRNPKSAARVPFEPAFFQERTRDAMKDPGIVDAKKLSPLLVGYPRATIGRGWGQATPGRKPQD